MMYWWFPLVLIFDLAGYLYYVYITMKKNALTEDEQSVRVELASFFMLYLGILVLLGCFPLESWFVRFVLPFVVFGMFAIWFGFMIEGGMCSEV